MSRICVDLMISQSLRMLSLLSGVTEVEFKLLAFIMICVTSSYILVVIIELLLSSCYSHQTKFCTCLASRLLYFLLMNFMPSVILLMFTTPS